MFETCYSLLLPNKTILINGPKAHWLRGLEFHLINSNHAKGLSSTYTGKHPDNHLHSMRWKQTSAWHRKAQSLTTYCCQWDWITDRITNQKQNEQLLAQWSCSQIFILLESRQWSCQPAIVTRLKRSPKRSQLTSHLWHCISWREATKPLFFYSRCQRFSITSSGSILTTAKVLRTDIVLKCCKAMYKSWKRKLLSQMSPEGSEIQWPICQMKRSTLRLMGLQGLKSQWQEDVPVVGC